MSYVTQRCSKGHTHWVVKQVKEQECGMACVGVLLKQRGITKPLDELRKVSQKFGGHYRPGASDVVRGESQKINAQHMMAALLTHPGQQTLGLVTQARAGDLGTQATNLARMLQHFGVNATATWEDPRQAKSRVRTRARGGTSSIGLVRWVDAHGDDAGGHFIVISRAGRRFLRKHNDYCIMDPTYGLSTQQLPTMPGHPDGAAPRYQPPGQAGYGYLSGWYVLLH